MSDQLQWETSIIAPHSFSIQKGAYESTCILACVLHKGPWQKILNDRINMDTSVLHVDTFEQIEQKIAKYTVVGPSILINASSPGFQLMPKLTDDGLPNPAVKASLTEYGEAISASGNTDLRIMELPSLVGGVQSVQGKLHWLSKEVGICLFAYFPNYKSRDDFQNAEHLTPKDRLPSYPVLFVATWNSIIVSQLSTNLPIAKYWTGSVIGPTYRAVSVAKVYQKIFASYARSELGVVEMVGAIVESLGLGELLWDLKILRSGDLWEERIFEEIEAADSFQLFWSQKASESRNVTKEWMYALGLERKGFVKPIYWEDPMPKPHKKLGHLHFTRIQLPLTRDK